MLLTLHELSKSSVNSCRCKSGWSYSSLLSRLRLFGVVCLAGASFFISKLAMATITYEQFSAVDIRVGQIIAAEYLREARKPAIKLQIDFGPELGVKKSSAQITKHYQPEELVGKLVIAVVNFPPKQIGPLMSEVLTLGLPDANGEVVLLSPDIEVPLGGKLY